MDHKHGGHLQYFIEIFYFSINKHTLIFGAKNSTSNMARQRQARGKGWCFTIFDMEWEPPTGEEVLYDYLVWQKEKAPGTERLHYQGYLELKSKGRLAQAKAALGGGNHHLEKRGGTRQQARQYAMKEETREDGPWELGVWTGARAKRTIDEVYSMVKAGKTDEQILEEEPALFFRHHRGIDKARFVLNKRRAKERRRVKVYTYLGATGTGKSTKAFTENPGYFVPSVTRNGDLWWDGYEGGSRVQQIHR